MGRSSIRSSQGRRGSDRNLISKLVGAGLRAWHDASDRVRGSDLPRGLAGESRAREGNGRDPWLLPASPSLFPLPLRLLRRKDLFRRRVEAGKQRARERLAHCPLAVGSVRGAG